MDYDSEIQRIQRIQKAIEASGPCTDAWECGVDIQGKAHSPGDTCPNSVWDEMMDDFHCPILHSRALSLRKDVYEWLPAMVECYWQNGITPHDAEFLEAGSFVTFYRYGVLPIYLDLRTSNNAIILGRNLAWDTWNDAVSPYGKIINGFQLVEGWHIKYLLCLIAGSLLLSASVVAISTAILGNLEAGLTAGSYTLAITTLGLAVLTFLSAIF